MRVCAVICEYNPFHNGHARHLALAREASGADYMVCLMSGAVTQRGTFARHDKWTRAKMALLSGADLVLELPCHFACAPAPEFAGGGVRLLDALGVVTHLSFGCEKDALPFLSDAVRVLADEPPAFTAALREGLNAGLSYPRARAEALETVLPGVAAQISSPNAALALEYLRALPSSIQPVPIVREGGGYHDETLCALSSATAVRAALQKGDLDGALAAVPVPELLKAAEMQGAVHEEEALTQALFYRLYTSAPETLRTVRGMDEGLEYRLLKAMPGCTSRAELLAALKTKRYTHARLSRLLTDVLLDVPKNSSVPAYARILGFRKDAAPLLAAIKKNASVPIVTKAARFDRAQLALDVRAQNFWALGCKNPALRTPGQDFTTSCMIID